MEYCGMFFHKTLRQGSTNYHIPPLISYKLWLKMEMTLGTESPGWSLHGRLSNKVVNNVRRARIFGWNLPGYTSVFQLQFFSPCFRFSQSWKNYDAKVVLTDAVQYLVQSVKIWLAAAGLEYDPKAKKQPKRVFYRLCNGKVLIEQIYVRQLILSIQLSNIFPTRFNYGRKPSILNLPPPTLGFFSLVLWK